jgi:GNAT superfamily N-acetyltransferase
MPVARPARLSDLTGMLALFAVSEVSSAAEPFEHAAEIWRKTIESESTAVFVADADGIIAATCMLIMAPNLLRSGRQHGFLENVVTHPAHRGSGYGRAVVHAALEHAWRANCHHVLMQSGRTDPRVHRFYEGLGFQPGLRVGYVAMRPQNHARDGAPTP